MRSCIATHMPKSPATIPTGSPKFIPTPALIIGIMASTSTPFITNFVKEPLISSGISIPKNPARTNNAAMNTVIIIWGSFILLSIFFLLSRKSKGKFLIGRVRRQYLRKLSFAEYRNPVTDAL